MSATLVSPPLDVKKEEHISIGSKVEIVAPPTVFTTFCGQSTTTTTETTAAAEKPKGTCIICLTEDVFLIKSTPTCTHPADVCIDCVRETIQTNLASSYTTCPGGTGSSTGKCKKDLDEETKLRLCRGATKKEHIKLYERIDRLILDKCLEANGEFFYCSNPRGCGSGQCVVGGVEEANFLTCHICKVHTCLRHKVPMHYGLSCTEYDAEILSKGEERQNEELKQKLYKKCPTCNQDIDKNEGCDIITHCRYGHIQCNANRARLGKCDHGGLCGAKWCWLCLGVDLPDGRKNRKEGCRWFGFT